MRYVVRRAVPALALLAIVFASALVFAQVQNPPRRQRAQAAAGAPGHMFLQQLNLTDDQRTKIQSLMQQQRQAHQGEMQKMMDLRQQLKNAIFADNGPADTAGLQQQIQALQGQLENDRVNLEKQIASVLTADQRKQVRDMPGPGFGGRGRGMGRGMGHGPWW